MLWTFMACSAAWYKYGFVNAFILGCVITELDASLCLIANNQVQMAKQNGLMLENQRKQLEEMQNAQGTRAR